MHWIDPNCLLETQGAVEGFISTAMAESTECSSPDRGKRLCSFAWRPAREPRSKLAKRLCPGSSIAVRGTDLQTKHGRVIAAEEVDSDWPSLKRVKAQKHKDEPKHKKHCDDETVRRGVSSA